MGQNQPIGTRTILIVEDEALVRFDLVAFFEDAGWIVFDAGNADEAITILGRRDDIGVVVTDVQMPGDMDGVMLAHYIRQRFPPTMVFVVSGNVPLGPDDLPSRATFLPKPFDHHRLLRQAEASIP